MSEQTIIQGDCLEVMRGFADKSFDLVLTSPPYDNLRDYNEYSFDFEGTAKEITRLLKNGGVCVWVVGDATIDGSETGTSFRQAMYFKGLGLNLHDTMIYHKQGMSFPDTNRYFQGFEYMFVLSKGKPKTTNLLRDRKNTHAGTKIHGRQREKNGELKRRSRHGEEIPVFSVRTNIWSYATGMNNTTTDKEAFQHPAMFPEKLAQDHICSWTNVGDSVLYPFNGSGTTTKAAKYLERNAVGIDISEKYCEIARKRLAQGSLFSPTPTAVSAPNTLL